LKLLRILAYILLTLYTFVLVFIISFIGIVSLIVASIIGLFILPMLFGSPIGILGFIALIFIVAVSIIVRDLIVGPEIEKYVTSTGVDRSLILKYMDIARSLIEVMDIKSAITLHFTSILPIAAFAYRRGLKGYGVVIGSLILEFPEEEARAIIAHELAHIKNGDLMLMDLLTLPHRTSSTFLNLLRDALKYLVGSLIGILLVPFVLLLYLPIFLIHAFTVLVSRAISRFTEYKADETAAKYTSSQALARALVRYEELAHILAKAIYLRKIRIDPKAIHVDIYKYLKTMRMRFWDRLYYMFLSTHPPTTKRIKRLLKLQGLAEK